MLYYHTHPMEIIPITTRLFTPHDTIHNFIDEYLPEISDKSIVVVTSKIIALAQQRFTTIIDKQHKYDIIRHESEQTVETPWCLLTKRGNDWSANAGVDESNANGQLILLPHTIENEARAIRDYLVERHNLSSLGVIITDTRILPMRSGTSGVALAWAGINPIKNYIGTPDLFGRNLAMTQANIVHALAAGAVLVMGEGNESIPLVHITNAPVDFSSVSGSISDIAIEPYDDLYRPIYQLTK